MGISGQIDHPSVVEAYETVAAACRAAGKVLGMGGVYDQVNASRYIKIGARVLSGSDHNYLLAGASQRFGCRCESSKRLAHGVVAGAYSPVKPAFTGSLLPSSWRR